MTTKDSHFQLRLATSEADLLAAQRLRYSVFVTELGGDGPMVDHAGRFERDAHDPHFDHLVLVDTRRDAATLDHVVGVYRLLPGERAAQAGRFYSEDEYDLAPLRASGRRLLELGRSCVHRDYRGGSAMFLLWSGLADYVLRTRAEVLFGVASFHGTDVARLALPLSHLYHNHLAAPEVRVRAWPEHHIAMNLLPAEAIVPAAAIKQMPALIKAYLRLGGSVGDGAFIDRTFNTIDVCLLMDTAQMSGKHYGFYARRFEGAA
jgi:putative hemolysin